MWRHACWCVRVRRASSSKSRSLSKLSRGGFRLARRPVSGCTFPARCPLYSGLASVEPVSPCGTLHGFPYSWVFYNGVSGPLRGQQSSIFSLPRPDVRSTPSIRPGPSRPSVYLTDPPLAGTPRSGASDGSSLVCLHRDPHWEQQSFSYGVDSFIGNDRFTPSPLTRSSDNSLHSSRYSRLYLFCLLSAGVAHLTLVVWGGRHTSYLCSIHQSGFKLSTPGAWFRHLGVLSDQSVWPSNDKVTGWLTGSGWLDNDCNNDNCILSNLDLLVTVLYILDTCHLQVTKVTKGALNASQSEGVGDSICLAWHEHLHRGSSILNSFTGP